MASSEPIAIVGMACRFPVQVDSPATLWHALVAGLDSVREGPSGRWDFDAFHDPDPATPGRSVSRWASYFDDLTGFDASFFGISPREAAALDPQHRLLLETSWEALEHAGLPTRALDGAQCGVFVGLSHVDYLMRVVGRYGDVDAYVGTGNAHSTAAGRISYLLGVRGPSLAVDTACSSSLVAVHLAARSLQLRESDIALAGGANVLLRPELTIAASHWGMLSPTGRCHSFDSRADGFVRGEGAGVVVLKRLADAQRDGDRVLAVIRGSAVNSDGRSNGLVAPSSSAQRAVLQGAVASATIDPADVGLIESHGTGTPLGDPIEFDALSSVYGRGGYGCALGAIKTNLGHTEAAAGVAGLIKSVLCLRHGRIPPNLHFEQWNAAIAADETRFFVPTTSTTWPVQGGVKLAAVSSFGMSGTNAHLVLESSPRAVRLPVRRTRDRDSVVFPVSAGSERALREMARRLAEWLQGDGARVPLADVAHTLACRRSHHPSRLAVTAKTRHELAERLLAVTSSPMPHVVSGMAKSLQPLDLVWVFSGHGSQWAGMGSGLLDVDAAFTAAIDQIDPIVATESGFSVRRALRSRTLPDTIERTQPLLFAVQRGLATSLRARGVRPAAVIGHSMGEVAAAVESGVLSLNEGVRVVCRRSRLLGRIEGAGAIASVDLAQERVEADLAEQKIAGVTVAVRASPRSTVVAGRPAAIDRLVNAWRERDLMARVVTAGVAAHSPQVDPLLGPLMEVVADLAPERPRLRIYSTVTEDPRTNVTFDAGYWAANLRQPVRLMDAVRAAAEDGHICFLEVSPHPLVVHAVTETLHGDDIDDEGLVLPTLERDLDEVATMAKRVGELYCAGVSIDWQASHGDGNLADLPTTSWDHQRHWIDTPLPRPDEPADGSERSHPLLGTRVDVPETNERHVWQAEIGTDSLPWLADHRVDGDDVFPAAGFGEIALAAATRFFRCPVWQLEVSDLRLERSLPIGPHTRLSTSVTLMDTNQAQLEIVAKLSDEGPWHRHVSAVLRRRAERRASRTVDTNALIASHPTVVDVELPHRWMRREGYQYGPTFTSISTLRRSANPKPEQRTLLADLRVPSSAWAGSHTYSIHPVLLDAGLQTIGALVGDSGRRQSAVLTRIATLRILAPIGREVMCLAAATSHDKETPTWSIRLFATDGTVVAEAEGMTLAPPDWQIRSKHLDTLLHEVIWEADGDLGTAPGDARGRWTILGEVGGISQAVESRLRSRGATCLVTDIPLGVDEVTLRAQVRARWGDWAEPGQDKQLLRGVVLLADGSGEEADDGPTALAQARDRVRRLADLIHVLHSDPNLRPPRLRVVTRGAQAIPIDEGAAPKVCLDQIGIRGLARSAFSGAWEQPRPVMVDLDPDLRSSDELATQLVGELLAERDDDEVAWRGGRRLVARLSNAPLHRDASRGRPRRRVRYSRDVFGLTVGRPGDLDSLDLMVLGRRDPGPGEVEIRVHAAALTFRDVLTALGRCPVPKGAGPPALGTDCAGVVVAVGRDVEELRVGDEVYALASGAISSFVTVPAVFVSRVPAGVSLSAAATLPTAYATSWLALTDVARLRDGERILVHSAASGVGLAAISIARRRGVTILATAGTRARRKYLRDLGIAPVMDSRTASFVHETLEATDGAGVDVVLNSRSGRALRAGLDVLAVGGRLIVPGNRDIDADTRIDMAPFQRGITLSSVDLDMLSRTRPRRVRTVLDEVNAELANGNLEPLPHSELRLSQATTAFQRMAAARHIGKIVLRVPQRNSTTAVVPPRVAPAVRGDASYLISGGLGGLGIEVARWLAVSGAARVVLNGRSEPSAGTLRTIADLERGGTTVTVVLGDIAEDGVAERLVQAACRDGCDLRGVIHAAGVREDPTLPGASTASLDRIWRPKVVGAWRLHEATSDIDLDWFVMFSSLAAMIGAPGQGYYAAANAWMDGFAAWRSNRGLPALSVGWGPWDSVGMTADLVDRGYAAITPANALDTLEALIARERTWTGVFQPDVEAWFSISPSTASSSFFRTLARNHHPTREHKAHGALRIELESLSPAHRVERMRDYLLDQLRVVLGPAGERADSRSSLAGMGIDSLTALQLRNRFESDLGAKVPAVAVWTHPTVAALAGYLLERAGLAVPAESPGREDSPAGSFVRLVDRPRATVRLYCVPHIGGGASTFGGWVGALPASVELHALALPGREHRAGEAAATDLVRVTAEVADTLLEDPDPRPFGLFGHSGGGLLAFEIARILARSGGPRPVHLGVSAMLPPRHPEWDELVGERLKADPRITLGPMAQMPAGMLIDADLAVQARAAMLSDLELYGQVRATGAPLDIPISVFCGDDDPVYEPEKLVGWQAETTKTFGFHRYSGDHFYLRDHVRELLRDLTRDLLTAANERS